MNVAAESDNEWAGLRAIMVDFHDMARKTEACVMVLHHVSEQSEYGKDNKPPHRRAIHGKVSQLPALILTLNYNYSPYNSELQVAVGALTIFINELGYTVKTPGVYVAVPTETSEVKIYAG